MWPAVISTIILGSVILAYVEYMRQELMQQSGEVVEQRVRQSEYSNKELLRKMADDVNQNDRSLEYTTLELAAMMAQSEDRITKTIDYQKAQVVTYPQMLSAISTSEAAVSGAWRPAVASNAARIDALSNALVPIAATTSSNASAIQRNKESLLTLITELQKKLPQASGFEVSGATPTSLGIGLVASKESVDAIRARMPAGTGPVASADAVSKIASRLPSGSGFVAGADQVSAIQGRLPAGNGALASAEQVNSLQSVIAGMGENTAKALASIPKPSSNEWAPLAAFNSFSNLTDARYQVDTGRFAALSNAVKGLAAASGASASAANVAQLSASVASMSSRVPAPGALAQGDQLMSYANTARYVSGVLPPASSYTSVAQYSALSNAVRNVRESIPPPGTYAERGQFYTLSNYVRALPTEASMTAAITAARNQALGGVVQTTGLRILPAGSSSGGTVAPESITPVSSKAGNQWISTAMGLSDYDNVVVAGNMGRYGNDVATIGAHNKAFGRWSDLAINPDDGGSGNVGVGLRASTAPGKKLDVKGGIRASSEVCIGGTCITEADLIRLKNGKPSNGKYAPPHWQYDIIGTGHHNFIGMYGPIGFTAPTPGYIIATWSGHSHVPHHDWAGYYTILVDNTIVNDNPRFHDSHTHPQRHMGAQHMYIVRHWFALNVTVHAKVGAGSHTLTPAVAIGGGQRVYVNGSSVSWTFIPE